MTAVRVVSDGSGATMPGKKTLQEHERLMGHMADRLGVDLDEAEMRGDLRRGDREAMVLSCTNCISPEECQAWLERRDRADASPDYCRNGEALAGLRETGG